MTGVIHRQDLGICTRIYGLSRSRSDLLGLIPVLQEIGITMYFCEHFGEMPIVYPDAAKSKGVDSKFDKNSMAYKIMLMVLTEGTGNEQATIKDHFGAGKLHCASRGSTYGGSTHHRPKPADEKEGQ